MGQEERPDAKDLQPCSPSLMMPSIGFSEPSPTIGFVGARPLVIEIQPSLTPPYNEEVDYLGDNWDLNNEPDPPDTTKFSQLTIEEGRLLLHQRQYCLLLRLLLQKVNSSLHCYLFLFIM